MRDKASLLLLIRDPLSIFGLSAGRDFSLARVRMPAARREDNHFV